jgi:aryl-alcohol dehydrogenase-like predicted oxidoreductase
MRRTEYGNTGEFPDTCRGATYRSFDVAPVRRFLPNVIDLVWKTPAQIALAWLLAQKSWIVPIPGTTKRHRLEENVAAATVELSERDLREIEDAASQISVQGARYSDAAQRMINR